MITLAIDPGSAGGGSAFAAFCDRRLTDVFFAKPKGLLRVLPERVDRIIVEKPQADDRTKHVSARSTIALCWAGGAALGVCLARYPEASTREVTPAKWKGSEAKPLQHRRLWLLLSPGERELLGGGDTWRAIELACEEGALSRWGKPGASYYGSNDVHNLLDAAALGAWMHGRLRK